MLYLAFMMMKFHPQTQKNMIRLIFSFIFLGLSILGFTQQTINTSLTHDEIQRTYILYVPENYTGNDPVPLVFNFHGFTSNATEQMWYGDFRSIADTAGFLVVHPQGTLLNGNAHWNVGGWTGGSTIDDVGFTQALIDTIAAEYNINLDRVYATGMSNGGFMSFLLACQLSNKIAAIASVTGSMTPETFNDCDPQHPMPVLQIHGTIDAVVPYNGANFTKPISDALAYWVDYNHCDPNAITTDIPNSVVADGSTVNHTVYNDGNNGTTVEHFKVTGGGHTWPGTFFAVAGTNYDIDASFEIWKFFSRYDINGLIVTTDTEEPEESKFRLNIYPNPTSGYLYIDHDFEKPIDFELFSPIGELLLKGRIDTNNSTIDLSQLPANVYFLKAGEQAFKVLKN